MSWLFSQALVVEYSAATCWDGAPSAPLSVMPTPHKFWRNDKTMEPSDLSRFGLTCAPLTDDRGAALLTWFLEASHAKTSASQAREQASTVPEAACGATWRGSLARFDPDSASWKTPQRCFLGDSDECSVIWPRSGMTAGGQCWELPMLGRRTKETDSGLWPTPTTRDRGSDAPNRTGAPSLAVAVRATWPTPTAHNAKETNAPSEANRNEPTLAHLVGGHLNPTWVEWLMGWPLGWTDLKPLETDKSRSAPQLLGECSHVEEAA